MKYQNAKFLLPPGLFRQLQRYIQGGYLYVPAPEKERKRWGELSGYRKELEAAQPPNRKRGQSWRFA